MRHAFGEQHRLGAIGQIIAPELLIAFERTGRAIGVIVIEQVGEAAPRARRRLASFDERRIDSREALREKKERIAVERDVMNPLEQEEARGAGLKKLAVEERIGIEIDGAGERGLHFAIDRFDGIGRIADIDDTKREIVHCIGQHLMRHAVLDDDAHLHRFCLADRAPQRRLQRLDIERSDDLRQLREVEARIAQIELLAKEDARLSGREGKAEHGINPYVRARGCPGKR
ncbi:hypothetical protein AWB76_06562 [Caballeronia temeraria]|uniref:Uncharacterized protein n=1 Tax=Caballeronia temeraria TaxID=1777137 RepID=A0A158D9W8_9BURK|nr:hypothetical protein AWB76_06562 [Caballeronia temeraria]